MLLPIWHHLVSKPDWIFGGDPFPGAGTRVTFIEINMHVQIFRSEMIVAGVKLLPMSYCKSTGSLSTLDNPYLLERSPDKRLFT